MAIASNQSVPAPPSHKRLPGGEGLCTGSNGLALLRVSLAAMWLSHALLKIFGLPCPAPRLLDAHGLPGALAYVVVPVEIAGAPLLFGPSMRARSPADSRSWSAHSRCTAEWLGVHRCRRRLGIPAVPDSPRGAVAVGRWCVRAAALGSLHPGRRLDGSSARIAATPHYRARPCPSSPVAVSVLSCPARREGDEDYGIDRRSSGDWRAK